MPLIMPGRSGAPFPATALWFCRFRNKTRATATSWPSLHVGTEAAAQQWRRWCCWSSAAGVVLLLLALRSVATSSLEDPAMAMPPVEEGPWGQSDIFSEPTDPEMIEYLGRKRESLQTQVSVNNRCKLVMISAAAWVHSSLLRYDCDKILQIKTRGSRASFTAPR